MRHTYLSAVLFLFMGLPTTHAQNMMHDVWLSTPERHAPYLTQTMRERVLANLENGIVENTENLLKGECRVEMATDDYLRAVLGTGITLEMKLFVLDSQTTMPQNSWFHPGDTLLCVVKTFNADITESIIEIGFPDWSKMMVISQRSKLEAFLPDSLSKEDMSSIADALDPFVISVSLCEDEPNFVEHVCIPSWCDEEEKQKLSTLLVSRKRRLCELLSFEL